MKLATILNANDDARYKYYQYYHQYGHDRRKRQYHAFRARILRLDIDKDEEIEYWRGKYIRLIKGMS